MPECVQKFLETQDYILVRNIQKAIITGNLDDMSKYNSKADIKKTRLTYDNATVQLSNKNTRFQYELIKSGARAALFEDSISWLCLAGLALRVYRAEHIMKPLENYKDIDSFKLYLSDTGLLSAKKGVTSDDILYMNEELNDFKGGLTENYVDIQLTAAGYTTCYWMTERGAEVDFIIQRGNDIIPLEVKSADNTKAKSLRLYLESFKPPYAIKVTGRNFGFEKGIMSLPLYALFCLDKL